MAERALLAALDGSCRTPIAALARLSRATSSRSTRWSRAMTAAPYSARSREGAASDGEAMGRDAGHELRTRAPAALFVDAG